MVKFDGSQISICIVLTMYKKPHRLFTAKECTIIPQNPIIVTWLHRLTNIHLGITGNAPVNILSARRLPDSVIVDLGLDIDAAGVGELAAS